MLEQKSLVCVVCGFVSNDVDLVEYIEEFKSYLCSSCLGGLSYFGNNPYLMMRALQIVTNKFDDHHVYEITTHITEEKRPYQTQAFIKTMVDMYYVHLDKNADYSPANILGAGEVGLATRTWDKQSRIMNLMGFNIDIKKTTFNQPQNPKCESLDDSILDASVYFIIWRIYRKGQWGR